MTKFNLILLSFSIQIILTLGLSDPKKLEGTIISPSVSNLNLTNLWTGFEFSNPYIFTKVTWEQSSNSSLFLLGVFEGANDPSFIDAIPLNMIKDDEDKTLYELDIDVKLSFKYIRYVSSDNLTLISSFNVYGYEQSGSDDNINYYQVTNIPLISIHSDKPLPKSGFKALNDNQKVKCNTVIINNGKIEINRNGKMRLRGNGSRLQPKRSYQITFEKKTKVLDMPSTAKKWVLIANYMDKTLIRNLVAFKVSEILELKYTPTCKSVDLIFNGVYDGTYMICEKVEVGKNRVELGENEENYDDGFLIVIENDWSKSKEDYVVTSEKGIPMTIRYPDEPSDSQLSNLKNWFDNIERDVYNNITDLIDLDSFSKHFLLEEFISDIDFVYGSYYITKNYNDDKIYFGPGWDYDLAFDNDFRIYPTNEKTKWTYNFGGSAGTLRDFVAKTMSIQQVLDAVQSKWKEVTMYDLAPDVLINYINEQAELINESQKLNYQRWKILDKPVGMDPVARGSYEAEVSYLKSFIEDRFPLFTKMLLEANTSSFEVDVEEFKPNHDN